LISSSIFFISVPPEKPDEEIKDKNKLGISVFLVKKV